ncbi:MAG: hypothetical protein IKC77_03980 [Lentisphaeria bacterium]|nr:hypothetical protein [Lentisphaeria bacterium]
MAINDILAELVTKMGLKDSEYDTLLKSSLSLNSSIKNNQDKLDAIKEDAEAIEEQIRIKKKIYNELTSTLKQKIVKRELMSLLATYKRKEELIDIISDRIDNDRILCDKLEAVMFALKNPTRTEEIESASVDYDMMLDEWDNENSAIKDLQKRQYQSNVEDIPLDFAMQQLEKEKDEQFEKELADF